MSRLDPRDTRRDTGPSTSLPGRPSLSTRPPPTPGRQRVADKRRGQKSGPVTLGRGGCQPVTRRTPEKRRSERKEERGVKR